jgi:phenylalanine-4-hydroxylase
MRLKQHGYDCIEQVILTYALLSLARCRQSFELQSVMCSYNFDMLFAILCSVNHVQRVYQVGFSDLAASSAVPVMPF